MQNEGFFAFLAARMMPYRSSSVQRASIPGRAWRDRHASGTLFPANSGLIIVTHQILGSVFRFDYITGLTGFVSPKNSRAVNSSRAICASVRPAMQIAAHCVFFYAALLYMATIKVHCNI